MRSGSSERRTESRAPAGAETCDQRRAELIALLARGVLRVLAGAGSAAPNSAASILEPCCAVPLPLSQTAGLTAEGDRR